MYRAMHQPSSAEIIILDPRWREQIADLRVLDRQDALVCPQCSEPVRVRAGLIKRPHFAHKHLQNCPFAHQSPRLLQTRAVLYAWLVGKFGTADVSIEKRLDPGTELRPFDCWVEQGQTNFAYWIFDRLMPPDERKNLQALCAQYSLDVLWVFVIDLLRVDGLTPRNGLHLTTTERAFTRLSEMDQAWQTHFEQIGGSLHYLDPDRSTLTTYRNLNLRHKPQLYTGKRLQNSLEDVQVSNTTGDFVHPGEIEQLGRTQRKIASQKRQTEVRQQRAEDFLKRASFSKLLEEIDKTPSHSKIFERQATCRICGSFTSDWITYFGDTRECICRVCSKRE